MRKGKWTKTKKQWIDGELVAGGYSWICSFCGAEFISKKDCQRHEEKHEKGLFCCGIEMKGIIEPAGKEYYVCEKCGKRINIKEEENFSKLMKERDEKQVELDIIKSKTIESMWIAELTVLKTNYKRYKRERNDRQSGTSSRKIKIKRKRHQVKKKR